MELVVAPRIAIRRRWRVALSAALVLLAAVGCEDDNPESRTGTSKLPDLIAVTYLGSFEMRNTAVPQSTTHSYTYQVRWRFTYFGPGGALLPAGETETAPTEFPDVEINGEVKVTYREKADGNDLHCSMYVEPNPQARPSFVLAYDPKTDEVAVTHLEAPTFRLAKIVPYSDQNCVGGPGVNVFSAPADWNPLGDDGGRIGDATTTGENRFDKHWAWMHTFAGGQTRDYDATMKSLVHYEVYPATPEAK